MGARRGDISLLRHEAPLRRVARGLVSNAHDAEDLVQDALLEALRQGPDTPRKLRPWLNAVLRNAAARLHRREAIRITVEREGSARSMRAGDSVADAELRRRLNEHVSRLREPYRGPIRLRYFHGLSIEQISNRLHRRPSTVRSQISRGLALLRTSLASSGTRRVRSNVLFPLFARRLMRPFRRLAPRSAHAVLLVGVSGAILTLAIHGVRTHSPRSLADPSPLVAEPAPDLVLATAESGRRMPVESLAASPAPSPGAGALHVRAVSEAGEPVPDLDVVLSGSDSFGRSTDVRRRTDAGGDLVVADLPPGDWRVRTLRGGSRTATLRPAEVTRLVVTVSAGVDVEGAVLDPDGRPVAGCAIRVSRPDDPWTLTKVAETDGSGRFHVRGVARDVWLGATGPGSRSSEFIALSSLEPREEELQVLLRYGRPSEGPLSWVVRDSHGQPVAEAEVRVGRTRCSFRGRTFVDAEGRQKMRAMYFLMTTGEDGRFSIGPPSGPLTLTVRADGHAPWIGRVSHLIAGGATDIVLPPPGTICGRVRAADGRGVPGIPVRVRFEKHRLEATSRTGPDGSFVVRGVPPGPFTFFARGPEGQGSVVERGVLEDPGGRAPLDVTLSSSWTVRGLARDDEDRPLVGWRVELREDGLPSELADLRRLNDVGIVRSEHRTTVTRTDGSFAFEACEQERYRLWLFPPASTGPAPWARAADVRPGTAPVELRCRAALAPSSFITGSIPGASRARGMRVVVHSPDLADLLEIPIDGEGARFTAGPLAAGHHELWFVAPGPAPWRFASLDLEPNARVDLGSVSPPRAGSLEVSVSSADASPIDSLRAVLRAPPTITLYSGIPSSPLSVTEEGMIRCTDLRPGSYELRILAPTFVPVERTVHIEAGKVTRLDETLERGHPVQFRLGADWRSRDVDEITLTVRSPAFSSSYRSFRLDRNDPRYLWRTRLWLPAAEYQVEARTDTGLTASQSVDLRRPTAPTVVLELTD